MLSLTRTHHSARMRYVLVIANVQWQYLRQCLCGIAVPGCALSCAHMPMALIQWPQFAVRPLTNLSLIDEMESLSPIMDCKIANLSNDDTPQFYTACGRGHRSSFRILRYGLEVTQLAISELPANPSGIWTCRRNINGTFRRLGNHLPRY